MFILQIKNILIERANKQHDNKNDAHKKVWFIQLTAVCGRCRNLQYSRCYEFVHEAVWYHNTSAVAALTRNNRRV